MSERAERCSASGRTQSIDGEVIVAGRVESAWVYGERKRCNVCGQMVKFRVRATDLPPWARILPHRTDGTPCR